MEAAFDRAGNHPVLAQLEKWMQSPRKSQRRKVADLIELLTDFVNEPEKMPETELKYLRNDVWELKLGKLRILFGGGACEENGKTGVDRRTLTLPKRVTRANSSVTCGRATSSFHKDTDETPRKQIYLAIGILGQDGLK